MLMNSHHSFKMNLSSLTLSLRTAYNLISFCNFIINFHLRKTSDVSERLHKDICHVSVMIRDQNRINHVRKSKS